MSALDETLHSVSAEAFQFPGGYVNHRPMVAEALVALGHEDLLPAWALRSHPGGGRAPLRRPADVRWPEDRGRATLVSDWVAHFTAELDAAHWTDVASTWIPRLLPSIGTTLFHGLIRAAHAVRSLEVCDTPQRRAELARALGYWVARYEGGVGYIPSAGVTSTHEATVRPPDVAAFHATAIALAADSAEVFLGDPSFTTLHGVTGPMALDLLSEVIPADHRAAALSHLSTAIEHLHGDRSHASCGRPAQPLVPGDMVDDAIATGDPHAVKLVEACLRAHRATPDDAFLRAAAAGASLGHWHSSHH